MSNDDVASLAAPAELSDPFTDFCAAARGG